MIAKSYVRLSLIPLLMLLLGFAALGAPEPFRGPLLFSLTPNPLSAPGLALFARSLYLADALGLSLLGLASLEIWVLAIAWEHRRRRI